MKTNPSSCLKNNSLNSNVPSIKKIIAAIAINIIFFRL